METKWLLAVSLLWAAVQAQEFSSVLQRLSARTKNGDPAEASDVNMLYGEVVDGKAAALDKLTTLGKQGNPEAQDYLRFTYRLGIGVCQDTAQALKRYLKRPNRRLSLQVSMLAKCIIWAKVSPAISHRPRGGGANWLTRAMRNHSLNVCPERRRSEGFDDRVYVEQLGRGEGKSVWKDR